MTLSIANAQALECCNAVVDAADLGSGVAQAKLVIYDGTPPTNADTALSSNTVLAELDMTNPAFGAAVDVAPGARATAAAITSDTAANATGTASFFRILDRDSTSRIQGAVATSGGELTMNSVAIQINATVEVTSLTITMPEG